MKGLVADAKAFLDWTFSEDRKNFFGRRNKWQRRALRRARREVTAQCAAFVIGPSKVGPAAYCARGAETATRRDQSYRGPIPGSTVDPREILCRRRPCDKSPEAARPSNFRPTDDSETLSVRPSGPWTCIAAGLRQGPAVLGHKGRRNPDAGVGRNRRRPPEFA
jgi:hypothetical protein